MTRNTPLSSTTRLSAHSLFAALSITAGVSLLSFSAPAHAIDARVKIACASDYYAYCSAHKLGSPMLRQCMRAAGPKLSKRCVNALTAAGEVTEAEAARRSASLR
ncbi:MAG: hypothetical protein ACRCS9_06390 [Hyphomicrobium sp.]